MQSGGKGTWHSIFNLLPVESRDFYTTSLIDELMRSIGRPMRTRENRNTRRKTSPSATLSTTHPTWTVLGLNLGEERNQVTA
jgi:hypothetical protein